MKTDARAIFYSKSFLFHFLPTAVVLLALLSVTIWAFVSANESLDREENRVIAERAEDTKSAIQRRLSTYEEILRGGAGLFAASNEVTSTDWQRYISFFKLPERYPGIQGVGYSDVVSAEERAQITIDTGNDGLDDIGILPNPNQELFTAVKYIEPHSERNLRAIGFDMYAEPIRRAAMKKAIDSGGLVFTEKVVLVQDTKTNQPGFIVYMPVYETGLPLDTVDQRRQAISGFIYAPFRASDLLKGIFPAGSQDAAIKIYTNRASNDTLLYKSSKYDSIAASDRVISYSDSTAFNGVNWIIEYKFDGSIVSDAFRSRPVGALASGVLLSVLTAGLVLTLLIARTRSLASLKEREVQSAKDDLLSLASHQLRTPATGVKQYIGMILEGYAGSLKDDQRMYLEKAYESNERQLHIINELLYVAKADAGRIVLAKRDIKICELVKDIVSEHKQSAKNSNISIRVKLPSRDFSINADKHCLRMSIENLLSNALKYTPEGGRVTVTVSRTNECTFISIKDTGVGISNEDKNRLFNRFTRIPNQLSNQTNGSGIGLYLAKNLIQLHGGDISVESKVGKGTTFIISLPNES